MKKMISILLIILIALTTTSCSLATQEKAIETAVTDDKQIGVFIKVYFMDESKNKPHYLEFDQEKSIYFYVDETESLTTINGRGIKGKYSVHENYEYEEKIWLYQKTELQLYIDHSLKDAIISVQGIFKNREGNLYTKNTSLAISSIDEGITYTSEQEYKNITNTKNTLTHINVKIIGVEILEEMRLIEFNSKNEKIKETKIIKNDKPSDYKKSDDTNYLIAENYFRNSLGELTIKREIIDKKTYEYAFSVDGIVMHEMLMIE